VLSRCYVGDWFVLQQLSRNVNVYFYREFIKELKREMKRHPKGKIRFENDDDDDGRLVLPGMSGSSAFKEARPPSRQGSVSADAAKQFELFPYSRPDNPEPEPEKQKSQYLLRIEHEQRLMPGMRGRRGRGRGRGKGRGKGRKR